jgi:hypothetical protein
MHQHKIVAQILLILTILNSVPAAPVLPLQEIPKARGAVAVRVPAEGVVAVLEKRPFVPLYEPEISVGSSPDHTGPLSMTYPEISGPQSTTNPEHTGPQSTNPENPEAQSTTNHEISGPQSTSNPGPQSTNPENPEAQSTTNHENPGPQSTTNPEHTGPQSTETGEVHDGASSQESKPPEPVSSEAAWRQKILTPENIKVIKYIGGSGLLVSAYLALLYPDITHGDGQDS